MRSRINFHSSSTNTTLTVASNSDQTYEYEFGKTIKCTKFGGQGSITSQTVGGFTFEPTYSECILAGIAFSKAEISMNGCYYNYTMDFGSANTGFIEVRCPTIAKVQQQITITVKVFGASVCTFHIGQQNPTGSYDFSNSQATLVNFTSTQYSVDATRQGGSECGAASSETGILGGEFVLKGEITGQQTQAAFQVG
jgi:hypothetical protein